MARIEWNPGNAFRCGRCGGFEVDRLADGWARCRACGLTVRPTTPRRFAGLVRAILVLGGVLAAVVAIEFVSVLLVAGSRSSVPILFGEAIAVTGVVPLVLAAAEAVFGTQSVRARGAQDILGNLFWRKGEFGDIGTVAVLAGSGLVLVAAAAPLVLAGL